MVCGQLYQLIEKINDMDRPGLMQMLRGMRCDFKIDFTQEFLESVSVERLRHIVLAASLHDRSCTQRATA
jgi:hypothetical protein